MSLIKDIKGTAKGSVRQTLTDAVTRAEFAAKDAANGLIDQATGSLKMDKNFIHIREFYNFMRIGNGQNVPTPFFYFSPNFYGGVNEIDLETGVAEENAFFRSHIGEFARFRYCIQQIELPGLSMKSFSSGASGHQRRHRLPEPRRHLRRLHVSRQLLPARRIQHLLHEGPQHAEARRRELHLPVDARGAEVQLRRQRRADACPAREHGGEVLAPGAHHKGDGGREARFRLLRHRDVPRQDSAGTPRRRWPPNRRSSEP